LGGDLKFLEQENDWNGFGIFISKYLSKFKLYPRLRHSSQKIVQFLVHFPIGKRHYCPRFVRPSVRLSVRLSVCLSPYLLLQFKLFRCGFLLKMCGLGQAKG